MKKVFALLLALAMLLTCMVGCTPAEEVEAEKPAASAEKPAAEQAGEAAGSDNQAVSDDGKIWIGVVTHMTGNMAALGEYQVTTNDAWADYINKNGGILGKEVAFEYFDCVDDIQTALNAFQMACEDERFVAISMSTYSQNCIAALDLATEAKIPTFMGGSGDAINVGNEYVWMTRPLDSAAGAAMASFMKKEGYTKPVVVHNTLASCQAGAEALCESLVEQGFDFDKSKMVFGYENTERNFAPLVAQMRETDADCLMFFGNQEDGAALSKAIQDAGWDIPRIGNSTISHNVTMELAGSAINGWYCVAESVIEDENELNQEWIQILKDYYGEDFVMTTNYYGCNIGNALKWAMETCGSTTDRDLINETLKSIDMPTANGHLKYFGENDIASAMYICKMVDLKPQLVEAVSYR